VALVESDEDNDPGILAVAGGVVVVVSGADLFGRSDGGKDVVALVIDGVDENEFDGSN